MLEERGHISDDGRLIYNCAEHICGKNKVVQSHIDRPVFAPVVPSGSSRGAMPRLRLANAKACWMFSLGSLNKLALRSTKAGFIDLIRARNARPLLQLFPKSSTSTPNLQHISRSDPFQPDVWPRFRIFSRRTLTCIFGLAAAERGRFSHDALTLWQPACPCLAGCQHQIHQSV